MIYARRLEHLVNPEIRAMFERAQTMRHPVNLAVGQPYFAVPAEARAAAVRAIEEGRNGYTPTSGVAPLKAAIAESLAAEGVRPEEVMPVAGGSGGLLLALMALVDERHDVLIPDPYFVSYEPLVRMTGATPVYIDTYPDFRLTPERLRASARPPRARVLLFNNPCNPTGVAYTPDEVAALAAAARDLGLTTIADEVYDRFSFDHVHCCWLKHDPDAVLVRAFSKTYAMPGWRVGFVAGRSELLERLAALQQFIFVCVHQPSQWAAVAALSTDTAWVTGDYRRKRDLVYELLRHDFDVVRPEGAFYIFPRAPGGAAAAFLERCYARELVVVPGRAFSRRDTHFRVSFSAPEEVLRRGCALLCELARESEQR